MSDPRKTTAAQWDEVWRGTRVPVRPGRINPSVISTRRLLLGALPGTATSIFELGCAPGAWLADLHLRTGLRVGGCDLSPEGVAWTRRNFARWLFEDSPRGIAFTPSRWRRGALSGPGAYRS